MNMYIDCLKDSGYVEHVQDMKKQNVEVLLKENKKHDIKCYVNCLYSPDFSIIENIWRTLKQRVKKHRCRTEEALREAIQYE